MSAKIDRRPQILDIYISAGDSIRIQIDLTDENNDPISISDRIINAQFRMSSRRGEVTPFNVEIIQVEEDGVTKDVLELYLSPESTKGKVKDNVWDCEIKSPDGADNYTPIGGKLIIEPDITEAPGG